MANILYTSDESRIIDDHFHVKESWLGKSADQSGNNWGTVASLTPFRAISGAGDFGSDPNDEAKLIGSDDTPVFSGNTQFDPHRIVIADQSATSIYCIRFIWGTGTMAQGEAAGDYSDLYVIANDAVSNRAGGAPFEVKIIRIKKGTKLWARVKNAGDNATIDFFIGIHEYTH